jgi:DNA ligase (NAD+)
LSNFLVALGIPNVGKTASKTISKFCKDEWRNFVFALSDKYDFTQLEDIGDIINESIYNWFNSQNVELTYLLSYIKFVVPEITCSTVKNKIFAGCKIYCTGSFASYKKDELKAIVEKNGGEFTSGYAKSLDYLVVGSLKSSSKEDKAKADGVKIISEDEFLKMIGYKYGI